MGEEVIYLYCITEKAPDLKEVESLVNKLYFVYHQGLYAVVSRVLKYEFSEENLKKNLNDMDWIMVKASLHEKVIEGIMRNTCVVPFKFATLFNTEDSLKACLEKHAEEFKENLEVFEGTEEWGLKIYCDIEKLKKTLLEEDEELLKMDREFNSSSPGKAFFLKKKKEELLNAVVNKKLNEYGQDSFERLSQESLQTRINNLLPIEVTERKDDMIFNTAFLIDKTKVAEFIQVVGVFKTWYKHKGLEFDCTGPWPPYNFCRLSKKELQNE